MWFYIFFALGGFVVLFFSLISIGVKTLTTKYMVLAATVLYTVGILCFSADSSLKVFTEAKLPFLIFVCVLIGNTGLMTSMLYQVTLEKKYPWFYY
jgi:hypothetical protein